MVLGIVIGMMAASAMLIPVNKTSVGGSTEHVIMKSNVAESVDKTDVYLFDSLPAAIRIAVADGSNRLDLSPYINTVLACGCRVDTGRYLYRISGRLDPAPGTTLAGHGVFLAEPGFSDKGRVDGLNMMIRIVDGLRLERDVIFDGGSITRSGFWLYGARNTGPVNDVRIDSFFRNLSFTGIDISRNDGGWANTGIASSAHVENVGWSGANFEGVTRLDIGGLNVRRTGWSAIAVSHSRDVQGRGVSANKAERPYRIFDGPGGFGGQEKGFLFSHFATTHMRLQDIDLNDNRHAGFDGFGIGEDGALGDPESEDIEVTGRILNAGLFGFDVSSRMKANITVIGSARQAVQVGLDLGGTLHDIDVTANISDVGQDEAVRFSATGSAPRTVIFLKASKVAKIVSGGPFFVAAGQQVFGAGLPIGTIVTKVVGNQVTLNHQAMRQGSTPVTFRGAIAFRNIRVQIRARNVPHAIGVESEADGFASYDNVIVTGLVRQARSTGPKLLNGPLPKGISISGLAIR